MIMTRRKNNPILNERRKNHTLSDEELAVLIKKSTVSASEFQKKNVKNENENGYKKE